MRTQFIKQSNYSDNLTAYFGSIRVMGHLNRRHKNYFDNYLGIRVGYYYDTNVPTYPNYQSSPGFLYALGAPVVHGLAYQVFYGLSFYEEVVGFNLEIGIGTPFLLQGGLSIRI